MTTTGTGTTGEYFGGDGNPSLLVVSDEPASVVNACCMPGHAPGCGDAEIESCTCDADPQCCEPGVAWDAACVATAIEAACLSC